MRNQIKLLIEVRIIFLAVALMLMADAFGNRETEGHNDAMEFLISAGFVAIHLALSVASLYVKDKD
jgi:NADH:ubiquinone oxidoreductase subunit K